MEDTNPVPNVQAPNPLPEDATHQALRAGKPQLLTISLFILLLSSLSLSVFLLYQNLQLQKKIQTMIPQPTETFPPKLVDPTANWKTYTDDDLGFGFKYPNDYKLTSSTINGRIDNSRVDFGINSITYLSLIKKDLINYDENNPCSQNTKFYPCIHSTGFNQKTPIENILLDGKKAKSFYISITSKLDDNYRIIRTDESPFIELRMYVVGTGLNKTFDQILSTFKFTGQVGTSGWEVFEVPGIYYYFKHPKNLELGGANEWSTFILDSKELFRFVYNGNKNNETLENFIDNYQEFFRGQNKIHWGPRVILKVGKLNGFEVDEPEFNNTYTFLQHPTGKGFMIFMHKKGSTETETLIKNIINTSSYAPRYD